MTDTVGYLANGYPSLLLAKEMSTVSNYVVSICPGKQTPSVTLRHNHDWFYVGQLLS